MAPQLADLHGRAVADLDDPVGEPARLRDGHDLVPDEDVGEQDAGASTSIGIGSLRSKGLHREQIERPLAFSLKRNKIKTLHGWVE